MRWDTHGFSKKFTLWFDEKSNCIAWGLDWNYYAEASEFLDNPSSIQGQRSPSSNGTTQRILPKAQIICVESPRLRACESGTGNEINQVRNNTQQSCINCQSESEPRLHLACAFKLFNSICLFVATSAPTGSNLQGR